MNIRINWRGEVDENVYNVTHLVNDGDGKIWVMHKVQLPSGPSALSFTVPPNCPIYINEPIPKSDVLVWTRFVFSLALGVVAGLVYLLLKEILS